MFKLNFMIPLPSLPKIIEEKENRALFEIKGLYPGYGITIGNSLRRVLLSSLEGSAITQVKIKGASHEFSTIPNVAEDVVNILLNLKQLRFKMFSDEPQTITLSVKGEKEVKGLDFKVPTQAELINKDMKICTLTSKSAEIEMEILVEKGIGYEPIERRKSEKVGVGVIPLDAIYTPVRKVSFNVENMRVGDRTDYDKLNIEVETDGSITPQQAISMASEVLINHFNLITQSFEQSSTLVEKSEKEPKIKVDDLKISNRTLSVLSDGGIKTADGLSKKSEKDLLELAGMGKEGIKEIKKSLKKLGLELKK